MIGKTTGHNQNEGRKIQINLARLAHRCRKEIEYRSTQIIVHPHWFLRCLRLCVLLVLLKADKLWLGLNTFN